MPEKDEIIVVKSMPEFTEKGIGSNKIFFKHAVKIRVTDSKSQYTNAFTATFIDKPKFKTKVNGNMYLEKDTINTPDWYFFEDDKASIMDIMRMQGGFA